MLVSYKTAFLSLYTNFFNLLTTLIISLLIPTFALQIGIGDDFRQFFLFDRLLAGDEKGLTF